MIPAFILPKKRRECVVMFFSENICGGRPSVFCSVVLNKIAPFFFDGTVLGVVSDWREICAGCHLRKIMNESSHHGDHADGKSNLAFALSVSPIIPSIRQWRLSKYVLPFIGCLEARWGIILMDDESNWNSEGTQFLEFIARLSTHPRCWFRVPMCGSVVFPFIHLH